MKKYLLITIVALLAIAGGAIYRCQQLQTDNERLHGNQSALMADIELYQTKAGENAAKVHTRKFSTLLQKLTTGKRVCQV